MTPGHRGLGLPLDVLQGHHPEPNAAMVMRASRELLLHPADVVEPLGLLGEERSRPEGGGKHAVPIAEEELQEQLVSGRSRSRRLGQPTPERVAALGRDLIDVARWAAGPAPGMTARKALSGELAEKVPWSCCEFFFGDERAVPIGDSRTNYPLALRSLLAPVIT